MHSTVIKVSMSLSSSATSAVSFLLQTLLPHLSVLMVPGLESQREGSGATLTQGWRSGWEGVETDHTGKDVSVWDGK